jgi:hypothetical protein
MVIFLYPFKKKGESYRVKDTTHDESKKNNFELEQMVNDHKIKKKKKKVIEFFK